MNDLKVVTPKDKIRLATKLILEAIGEDSTRDGLRETPDRVARALYDELLSGYQEDSEDVFKTFEEDGYDSLVLVKDIPFYSMCEHHMLPFLGVAHVAYIPNGRIIGLSKIARLVEIFAKRLQVQERLTQQIADALHRGVGAIGTMVVIEAEHLCMSMRGIKKPGAKTVTSAVRGAFLDDEKARAEFLALTKS